MTHQPEPPKDKNIVMAVYGGLTLFTALTSMFFVIISTSIKDNCLNSGGTYTEGVANALILYKSCTYSK